MSLTRYIQLKDTVPDMNLFARMVQLNTTWGNTATPHVIVSIHSILENFQIQMSSRGANSFPESLIQPPRGEWQEEWHWEQGCLTQLFYYFFDQAPETAAYKLPAPAPTYLRKVASPPDISISLNFLVLLEKEQNNALSGARSVPHSQIFARCAGIDIFCLFFAIFCFVLFCFVVVVVVIVIVDLYDGFRRKGWTANSQPREKTEKANSRMCLHVNAIW